MFTRVLWGLGTFPRIRLLLVVSLVVWAADTSAATSRSSKREAVGKSGYRDGSVLIRNRTKQTIRFRSRHAVDEDNRRSTYRKATVRSLSPGKSLNLRLVKRSVAIRSYGYVVMGEKGKPDRYFTDALEKDPPPNRRLQVDFTERHLDDFGDHLRRLAAAKEPAHQMEDCPKCGGRGTSAYFHKCRHCDGRKRTPVFPKGGLRIKDARLKRSYRNPQSALIVFKPGILPQGGESVRGFVQEIKPSGVTYIESERGVPRGRKMIAKSGGLRRVHTPDGVFEYDAKRGWFEFSGVRRPWSDSGPFGEAFNGIRDLKESWDTIPTALQAEIKSGAKWTLQQLHAIASKYEIEREIKRCELCRGKGENLLGVRCGTCRGLGLVIHERVIERR